MYGRSNGKASIKGMLNNMRPHEAGTTGNLSKQLDTCVGRRGKQEYQNESLHINVYSARICRGS